MRAMIKAAAAAAILLVATPALAMTVENSSPAGMAGARYLRGASSFAGSPTSGLQAALVGGGLRTDGGQEFSGDGASSYGYLTSAGPTDPAKARDFEDELSTYRTPGVTVHYATAPGAPAAATPQAK